MTLSKRVFECFGGIFRVLLQIYFVFGVNFFKIVRSKEESIFFSMVTLSF